MQFRIFLWKETFKRSSVSVINNVLYWPDYCISHTVTVNSTAAVGSKRESQDQDNVSVVSD
jgi:hypothetical protein